MDGALNRNGIPQNRMAYFEALALQRKFPDLLTLSDPSGWIHFLLEEHTESMVWWEQSLRTTVPLLGALTAHIPAAKDIFFCLWLRVKEQHKWIVVGKF